MSLSENKHFPSDSREFERLRRERYRSERMGGRHARKNNRSHRPSHAKATDAVQTYSKPHKRTSKPKSNAGVLFTSKNIRKGPSLSTYDSQQPVIWGIGLIVRRIVITLAILVMLALLIIGTRYISQKASYSSVGTQMNLLSTETADTSDEDLEENSTASASDEDSAEDSEEESNADTTDSSDDSE